MLSDLRRGCVDEEQDVFTPSASPDSAHLPLHTKLGGLLARRYRGSGGPPGSALLP